MLRKAFQRRVIIALQNTAQNKLRLAHRMYKQEGIQVSFLTGILEIVHRRKDYALKEEIVK